ncbi:hypothetical protein FRC12_001604 [Ceratobasidium sp. 428]|nr:hypothetical protein FRC12_001604 [Ceratobasidium sp. 428]
MTEDVQTFENGAASLPHTSTPTGLRTYGPEFTSRVSALRASVSQPINPQVAPYPFHLRAEPDPKPTSTSQPNRARSRMYTPQPLPRQSLRAAPTLGRSMYGDTDVREKSTEKEGNALRAAPTLGRSMLGDAPGGISSTGDAEDVETPEGMETAEVVHKRQHQDSSRSRRVLSSTPVPVPAPLSSPAHKAAKPPSQAIEPPSNPEPQPAPSKAPLVSESKVAGSASQPQLSSVPRSTTPVQEREDSAGVGPSIAVGPITRSFDDEFQRDERGRTASPAPESEGIHAPTDYPSVKSQSRSVEPESNGAEPKSPDYDAEYGSVPDVPSAVSQSEPQEPPHIIISSSPTNNGTWTLQRNRSSTPQFQSTLPRSGPPVLHVDSPPVRNKHRARRPGLATSTPRPVSLVSLGKRRRSSLAPSQSQETPRPVSKKIRREYDTVESGAFPKNTRAHEDTYDQWGRKRWVPDRPLMHRAPEVEEAKKIARPIERRVVISPESESEAANPDEGEAPPEDTAAADGSAQQGDGIIGQETAPENQEQESGEPRENFSSTEVPETPQLGPFAQFSESILEPIDKPSPPIAGPSRIADKAPVFVAEAPTPAVARSSPPASAPRSREQSRASPFVSFSSRRPRSRGSKRNSELSGLQFTPGSGPDRTRLSLGHRSGPAVEQVSERDAQILQKAGLKPTLKRLSQAHGFTTEIVADVYQEHGDLKETEEALREMKRSAERTRVKIARRVSMRDSTMGVFHGRQQEGESDDEVEADTFSAFDATRTRREILFGV